MSATSSAPDLGASGLLDAYRARVRHDASGVAAADLRHPAPPVTSVSDELVDGSAVRPEAVDLAETIESLGAAGLMARRAAVRRLVQDDGITYGSGSEGAAGRQWEVDPLPLIIDAAQWAALERGLDQRARLLDLVLADLYGSQRLLRERRIPAAAVLGHPGFLSAAVGTRLPTERQLFLHATDLARSGDGAWVVLSDRTQAPSGAGYAMANRRLIARSMEGLHRSTDIRRLRGFFDRMQLALDEVAPRTDDRPRVVLLTPGVWSETAFDQAFTATLLGRPLVQSDDLTMRGGRVWLRTTGRLEPIDVMLRRVDADYSDSLDLRPESRLGVPGLVEATRRGVVSVVNPLGAAVLENPALLPYLAEVSRTVLGEDLELPHAETWWCGDDVARRHVLARLDQLVLRPISRASGRPHIFGWELSAAELEDHRRSIEAQPWAWTAQEPMPLSTAPIVTPSGLQPRSLVLRTFALAEGGSYHVMPGGLGRVATEANSLLVTNQTGALSKDVWVLSSPAAEHRERDRTDAGELGRVRLAPQPAQTRGITLAPRSAEDLYWCGRYTERAEATTRLLVVADNLAADNINRPSTPGFSAMTATLQAVTEVTTVRPGFTGVGADDRLAHPFEHLRTLLTAPDVVGSVAFYARRAGQTASDVREQLSSDIWSVLSRLDRTLAEALAEGSESQIQPVGAKSLESLLALSGIVAEGLVRDSTWAFIDAGRRIERAQVITRLLRNTLAIERPPIVDGQLTEAVLRACDSVITHRRRMAAGLGPATPIGSAVDLLLLDGTNPRSVTYQMDRLGEDLSIVPDVRLATEIREIVTMLRAVDIDEVCQGGRLDLVDLLIALEQRLRSLADDIEATHFVHQAPQRSFVVAELMGRR